MGYFSDLDIELRSKPRKVQIIAIHPKDAFYDHSKNIVNEFGILKELRIETELGYESADIQLDGKFYTHSFYAVKFKEV